MNSHRHRSWAPTATISASSTTVTAGQKTVIKWSSTNSFKATLNGVAVATSGSETVTLKASEMLTLVETNSHGESTSAQVKITVSPVASKPLPTATITASPTTLTSGQKTVVTWTSTNATSATLNGATIGLSGSETITPSASEALKLVVTGTGGTATAQTQLTVSAPPAKPAPAATITASPTTIVAGKSTIISWTSSNATSATLNGAAVAISGSQTITPAASETLKFVAIGTGGSTTAQVQVAVTPAAPVAPPTIASSVSSAPHINYTDLNVGSGTGGDTGDGVYVRIFGNHFGTSQGSSTLTLGGSLVTTCGKCSWSDTTIVAQLGAAAKTGNIVVTVNGEASNGVPFTVTPTTILFVSASGLDTNSGTFAAPFKTWRAAFNSATGGDNNSPSQNTVIYIEPGTNVSFDDGRGYNAAISTDLGGSSPTKQLAIVGYPGGTVNVGSTSVSNGVHGWGQYLTIADLSIVGQSSAIDAEAGDIRMINNTLSCPAPPNGLGGTACVLAETMTPNDTWVFDGNLVNNTGGNVDKTYHAVYFSTGANHADVGWNNIGQGFKGYCRSIMFHASSGANLSDIHVHDNIITGGYCDAIGLASVDPSQGVVEAYNNVISHVAIASNPYGVANETGIAINSDPAGSTSGTVAIYNNTVVDAGGYTLGNQNGCFGIVSPGAGMHLTNNICSQPSSAQPYIQPGSQNVTGSNNLWYGAGSAPSWDTAPVIASPDFASATSFALQSASPAKSKGTASQTSTVDVVGTHRGNPPSVGAYD